MDSREHTKRLRDGHYYHGYGDGIFELVDHGKISVVIRQVTGENCFSEKMYMSRDSFDKHYQEIELPKREIIERMKQGKL